MNFEHLRLFKDIATERSMTRAAERNRVSQSAASQHVHELEKQLDVQLLDRSTRPLKLTAAGEAYFEFCRDVLQRREEFEGTLHRLKKQVEGSVRVASIYSVGLTEMWRLEEEFLSRHPGAEFVVEYLRPEKVYEAVVEDRADIGLVSYPEPSKELTVLPWRDEVMLVAVQPDHPLAVNTFLAPEQLGGQEMIGFDEDLPIARELRRYLKEHNVSVKVVLHFDSVVMLKEAVALGTGISILPEPVLRRDIEEERIIGIPLESPGLYRPLGIIHLRKKKLNRATESFLAVLERHRNERTRSEAGAAVSW